MIVNQNKKWALTIVIVIGFILLLFFTHKSDRIVVQNAEYNYVLGEMNLDTLNIGDEVVCKYKIVNKSNTKLYITEFHPFWTGKVLNNPKGEYYKGDTVIYEVLYKADAKFKGDFNHKCKLVGNVKGFIIYFTAKGYIK